MYADKQKNITKQKKRVVRVATIRMHEKKIWNQLSQRKHVLTYFIILSQWKLKKKESKID